MNSIAFAVFSMLMSSTCSRYCTLLTSLVVIDPFVQRHPRVTQFEDLVGVFNIVADIVVDDPRRVDKPGERQATLLVDGMRISRYIVEPAPD